MSNASAPSTFLLASEDKYDGTNWEHFKMLILGAALSKGLTGYLDGRIKKPNPADDVDTRKPTMWWGATEPTLEEWSQRDGYALGMIILNVKDPVGLGLKTDGTAHEAWESIRRNNDTTSELATLRAEDELHALKFNEGEDFDAHVAQLRLLWERANRKGAGITAMRFQAILLRSLPSSWSSFLSTLGDINDLDSVVNRLKSYIARSQQDMPSTSQRSTNVSAASRNRHNSSDGKIGRPAPRERGEGYPLPLPSPPAKKSLPVPGFELTPLQRTTKGVPGPSRGKEVEVLISSRTKKGKIVAHPIAQIKVPASATPSTSKPSKTPVSIPKGTSSPSKRKRHELESDIEEADEGEEYRAPKHSKTTHSRKSKKTSATAQVFPTSALKLRDLLQNLPRSNISMLPCTNCICNFRARNREVMNGCTFQGFGKPCGPCDRGNRPGCSHEMASEDIHKMAYCSAGFTAMNPYRIQEVIRALSDVGATYQSLVELATVQRNRYFEILIPLMRTWSEIEQRSPDDETLVQHFGNNPQRAAEFLKCISPFVKDFRSSSEDVRSLFLPGSSVKLSDMLSDFDLPFWPTGRASTSNVAITSQENEEGDDDNAESPGVEEEDDVESE
ncbi:hypothetical protein AX16_010734 [Volvariella volvacea WC 439]|nr:hypothetical protein AX16_010734 [Volvariella volvacea WC 439]